MTTHVSQRKADVPNVPDSIAADLLLRFLRDPLSASETPRLDNLDEHHSKWLEELVGWLGVSADRSQWRDVDVQRVRNALVHSLERGPASPDRAHAARDRLGDSGLLRTSEYRIEWPDALKEAESLGDRRAYIERTILEADVVQHLSNRGQTAAENTPGVSLFVRLISPNSGSRFAHLVVMTRKGASLRFMTSWRVIRAHIEWTPEMTALDLLKRFVDVFGLHFEAIGRPPTKFLLYDAVPWDGKSPPREVFKISGGRKTPFSAQFTFRLSADIGAVEISLAYVIDIDHYKRVLTEHGLLK